MTKYVVLGAGIIGLYTAFLLIEDEHINPKDIEIIAQHLPGDQSIEYASPYAGAYFSACIDEDDFKYSEYTYRNVGRVQQKLGENSGYGIVPSTEYLSEIPSAGYLKKLEAFLDDYQIVDPVLNSKIGVKYKAWVFNSPLVIQNLLSYLKKQEVSVNRRKLLHIKEAFKGDTNVVFNCTGIGSLKLGGVEDEKSYPTRGQVVVISAPHVTECVSKWDDKSTYIIKRPDSNTDEVILGGFYQKGNFDLSTYGYETDDILKRTIELYPKLLSENLSGEKLADLKILRVVAGVRPSRKGGVRIEKEQFSPEQYVIHNYGAGGCGYLCGLGMAHEAVSLL
ncbi:uncharacterized protein PRCAT00003610001 [Priceomyces carsonii]|uniref:uncharacterized protein n=1 Tax=Priceomyces carsonii TaxID=28549 RepID=UPI002ED7D102|nr:unnamed protein product [Priceomyces carsonii]